MRKTQENIFSKKKKKKKKYNCIAFIIFFAENEIQ